MRVAAFNFAAGPENQRFGHRLTAVVRVKKRQTGGADQDIFQFETEISDVEPDFPIITHGAFALKHSRFDSHPLDDQRRAHFEIVGIMPENPLKIMRIPGIDPIGGKQICGFAIKHQFFPNSELTPACARRRAPPKMPESKSLMRLKIRNLARSSKIE